MGNNLEVMERNITRRTQDSRVSHHTHTSGWLPPIDIWDSSQSNLPYGWESARSKDGRTYYVNHLSKTTTYEPPNVWDKYEAEEASKPRRITLERDPELGFGFVAGSERPVIVRFVTTGGPSVDKLMPGDQILNINGEDVKLAPRDHVIRLVRNSTESVCLLVCQPPLDNSSTRKSALLSATKKAKLRTKPSRVRFAESVDINDPSSQSQTHPNDSVLPLMPNVLKVFLENGQTKSFKYDSTTTVQDVINSLQAKLGLKSSKSFGLMVEHIKSLRRNKLTILNPKERLTMIASRPGSQNLRCLFRVTFVPEDAYELLREDPMAFEYLYVQCCNDVMQERFAPELKYDFAFKLAALQMHQHLLSNNESLTKVTIKMVEREFGLDRFVPSSVGDSMKPKELRKVLAHFLKLNQRLSSTPQKVLTPLQAKLHYLRIISDLPSYGAKCFSSSINESNVESAILVSPRFGVSQINNMGHNVPINLCDIDKISRIEAVKNEERFQRIEIHTTDMDKKPTSLLLEDNDAEELILVLQGYFRLLTSLELEVKREPSQFAPQVPAPAYCSKHAVVPSGWNYAGSPERTNALESKNYPVVDLGEHPPYRHPSEGHEVPLPENPNEQDRHLNSESEDSDSRQNVNLDSPRSSISHRSLSKTVNHHSPVPERIRSNRDTGQLIRSTHHNEALNEAVIRNRTSNGLGPKPHSIQGVRSSGETLESGASSNSSNGSGTDSESVITFKSEMSATADSFGKLKHSDSLLLLSKVAEDSDDYTQGLTQAVNESLSFDKSAHVKNFPELGGPYSESPPKGRVNPVVITKRLKPSDSSFGLHADDEMNSASVQDTNMDSKLKEDARGRSNARAKADQDLIDLTMIPPPMTPDEDGPFQSTTSTSNAFSTPPTPFADRQSLDAELRALEIDLGRISSIKDFGSDHESTWNSATLSTANAIMDHVYHMDESRTSGIAALYQMRDIDSFIENMAVPPPPPQNNNEGSLRDHSDLSAFIIPPPPTGLPQRPPKNVRIPTSFLSPSSSSSLMASSEREKNASFQTSSGSTEHKFVKNSLTKVNMDREVDEVNVNQNVKQISTSTSAVIVNDRGEKISPRIASLQQKLLSPSNDGPGSQLSAQSSSLPIQVGKTFMPASPGSSGFSATPPPPPPPPRSSTLARSRVPQNLTHSSIQSGLKPQLSLPLVTNNLEPEVSSNPSQVDEIPPSLPPRMSPLKSWDVKPTQEPPLHPTPTYIVPGTFHTTIQSSIKPAVPARSSKPVTKLVRSLPDIPVENGDTVQRLGETGTEEGKPKLPAKTIPSSERVMVNVSGRKLPITPPKPKLANIDLQRDLKSSPGRTFPASISVDPVELYSNSEFDPDDGSSLEGTSVDDETFPSNLNSSHRNPAIVFQRAESDIKKVVSHLSKSCELIKTRHNCPTTQKNETSAEQSYHHICEQLTDECRQFVTASKLFVKSATESENQLLQCLEHCVKMIQRIGTICRAIAECEKKSDQTEGLISKVKDMAETYLQTVQAASLALGQGVNDPSMNVLMKKATSLASVLTILMRSLRVFSA
ncbi:uncharacterized protein LOC131877834 isoform X3 [Tigriopus californicus]|uniref:uncharacterized protein LOC131877834 isoform X3 n=1 Tax=Tigriopus californicus TaxID=6832 RepID=UPI0027DA889A|nr:uncharacterized protein LOC131877834 isoform X3 [Tigriopus californicus]